MADISTKKGQSILTNVYPVASCITKQTKINKVICQSLKQRKAGKQQVDNTILQ
jgi:hypothetical protein